MLKKQNIWVSRKVKSVFWEAFLYVLFLGLFVLLLKMNLWEFDLLKNHYKFITESAWYLYIWAILQHSSILIQTIILLFIFPKKILGYSFEEIGIYWDRYTLRNIFYGIIIILLAVLVIWGAYVLQFKPIYSLKMPILKILLLLPLLIAAFPLEAIYEEMVFRGWIVSGKTSTYLTEDKWG